MSKDFELTPEALATFEGQLEKVDEIGQKFLNDLMDDYTGHIREHVIVPFCRKHQLRFIAGNGGWNFIINYEGADFDKIWYIGEQPRPLPKRPNTVEGDEDHWFEAVTDEDHRIKKLLDRGVDWCNTSIGALILDYPNKDGT
jgi:hypothetical protein